MTGISCPASRSMDARSQASVSPVFRLQTTRSKRSSPERSSSASAHPWACNRSGVLLWLRSMKWPSSVSCRCPSSDMMKES